MTVARTKPGVAFWATVVVIVVLLAYPLSFGPACWLNERGLVGRAAVSAVYSPVLATAENGRLPKVIDWYARLAAKPDAFPFVSDGTITWWKNLKPRRMKPTYIPI